MTAAAAQHANFLHANGLQVGQVGTLVSRVQHEYIRSLGTDAYFTRLPGHSTRLASHRRYAPGCLYAPIIELIVTPTAVARES